MLVLCDKKLCGAKSVSLNQSRLKKLHTTVIYNKLPFIFLVKFKMVTGRAALFLRENVVSLRFWPTLFVLDEESIYAYVKRPFSPV